MNDSLLRLVILLAYGPFFLMLGVFLAALLLKWAGTPAFLNWLVRKTNAPQPLKRKASSHTSIQEQAHK